jgi:hypothetical protein
MLMERLTSPMTLVWLIYFSVMELISLGPLQASSCILISEEAKAENYSGDYACATMHEAIFRLIRYVWRHASHDNVIAFGTILIAIFTYVLYRSTDKLWEAGDQQFKIIREEFTATHRPRLHVRNVVVNRPVTIHDQRFPLFQAGHIVRGQFFVVNTGGSDARVQDGHCLVFWTIRDLPMRRPYEGADDNLQIMKRILRPGESTSVLFNSDEPLPESLRNIGGNEIGRANVYVMGWITYLDESDIVRRTSFCRRYQQNPSGDGRFVIEENTDYEHEE